MLKKLLIIGGGLILVLGGLIFGLDKFADSKAEIEFEKRLNSKTGLEVDVAKADVNFFKQNVKITDIRFNNVEGFSSDYIFQIASFDIQTKGLMKKPLEIEKMVIQDITVNVDIESDVNFSKPEDIFKINLEKLSQNNEKSSPNLTNTYQKKENENVTIDEIQFLNIQCKINLKIPLQSEAIKKEFTIEEIILNNVTDDNIQDKLSEVLQEKVLTEVQKLISQENIPQLDQILEEFNKNNPFSSSESLPKSSSPSQPSQPKLPEKPSLP